MKVISIKVDGVDTTFNANKIKTDTLDGDSQYWIPKSEAVDYVDCGDDPPVFTQNGLYRVRKPGENYTGLVNVDENGFVEYVLPTEGIKDFITGVVFTVQDDFIISENGTYTPTVPPATSFKKVIVNVQPKTVRLTAQKNGVYEPQNYDGYDKVIVDVQDPYPDEYIEKHIDDNGTYRASDGAYGGSYGYSVLYVNCKKNQVKTTGWQLHSTIPYSAVQIDSSFFNHTKSATLDNTIYAVKGTHIAAFTKYTTMFDDTPEDFGTPDVVAYKGKIWVFSGSHVWTYDINRPTPWHQEADTPEAIEHAIVHDGRLFVQLAIQNELYVYDDDEEEWNIQCHMQKYTGAELVSYYDKVIQFGGNLGTTVYAYDVETGAIERVEDMVFQVSRPKAIVHNHTIRSIGCAYSASIANHKEAFSDQGYNGDFWRTESFLTHTDGYGEKHPIYSDDIIVGEIDGELYIIGKTPGDSDTFSMWYAVEEDI